jgi:2-polyprenyl-3-methyl-5-hydroxy-6-metoxy-1,4-benzoquinol methylase
LELNFCGEKVKFETNIAKRISGRHKACLEMENFENKKILDIGCSYGWFEKFVGEKAEKIIGIDLDEKDLENAKSEVKLKNVKFEKGSALNLKKFKKDYFDIVIMFDVIEHIPKNSEDLVLKEIKRVLKKNGKLLISTPANNFSNFFDPAWYFGHRHYSKSKMQNIFENAGFIVEKMEIKGGFFEIFSMILFYPFKWFFNMEIPFKTWFDKKRDEEYLKNKNGFVTLFIWGRK